MLLCPYSQSPAQRDQKDAASSYDTQPNHVDRTPAWHGSIHSDPVTCPCAIPLNCFFLVYKTLASPPPSNFQDRHLSPYLQAVPRKWLCQFHWTGGKSGKVFPSSQRIGGLADC